MWEVWEVWEETTFKVNLPSLPFPLRRGVSRLNQQSLFYLFYFPWRSRLHILHQLVTHPDVQNLINISPCLTIEEAKQNLVEAIDLFLELADSSEVAKRLKKETFITQLEVNVE